MVYTTENSQDGNNGVRTSTTPGANDFEVFINSESPGSSIKEYIGLDATTDPENIKNLKIYSAS